MIELQPFLDDRDKHIDRYGDPDLCLDGILRCAIEQFDLPTALETWTRTPDSVLNRFNLSSTSLGGCWLGGVLGKLL